MQKSGSPVKHTTLWTSAVSFGWMSSAAVCEVAPRSWVRFVLVVGSRMWLSHYIDAVLISQHCKVFWEGWGSGRCDTLPSLIPLLTGSPKWWWSPPPPGFACFACLFCLPSPTGAEDGGARVNSDTLLARTLLASGGETDTNLPPALSLPSWGRVVVKWSGLCFGEEGKDRVCSGRCSINTAILWCWNVSYPSVTHSQSNSCCLYWVVWYRSACWPSS